MLNLSFDIYNPFAKHNTFKNLYCYAKAVLWTKFKMFEVELLYYPRKFLSFQINSSYKCDHAGFGIEIGLLGYTVSATIYDTRHWNYDESKWY